MNQHFRKLFICIFIISISFSQQKVNINFLSEYGGKEFSPFNDKPFTGTVFDIHESNGQKKLEGTFRNGYKNGRWTYFSESGNIRKVENYKNNQLDGKTTYYFGDGNIMFEENYIMDRNESSFTNTLLGTWTLLKMKKIKDGEWEEIYNEEIDEVFTFVFKKDSVYSYKNGIIYDSYPIEIDEENKLFRDLKNDGIIFSSLSYDFLEFQNEEYLLTLERVFPDNYEKIISNKVFKKYFYNNGHTFKEGFLENNKLNGEWKFYHNNGVLNGEGKFILSDGSDLGGSGIPRNGRMGLWKFYDISGNLSEESFYENGLINGLSKRYHENGQLKSIGNYNDDLQEGNWKFYFENGKLLSEEIKIIHSKIRSVVKSKIINRYDFNGNEQVSNGFGYIKEINNDDKIIFECNVIDGFCQGKVFWNYLPERDYIDDDVFQHHEYFLKNGLLHGDFKVFKGYHDKFIENYEQSKLMTKGYYEEGLKHGTWIFYDNGIPTEKESYKLGKKNGIYIDYYSSGEVRTKGWYKDNMKDSVWLNFNYYGDTTWTETYIMDKLVSED